MPRYHYDSGPEDDDLKGDNYCRLIMTGIDDVEIVYDLHVNTRLRRAFEKWAKAHGGTVRFQPGKKYYIDVKLNPLLQKRAHKISAFNESKDPEISVSKEGSAKDANKCHLTIEELNGDKTTVSLGMDSSFDEALKAWAEHRGYDLST